MYNRPIHIYCYSAEPINIFQVSFLLVKVNQNKKQKRTRVTKKYQSFFSGNEQWEAELEGELNEFEMVSSKADTESNDPEWENQIQQMLDAEENQIN